MKSIHPAHYAPPSSNSPPEPLLQPLINRDLKEYSIGQENDPKSISGLATYSISICPCLPKEMPQLQAVTAHLNKHWLIMGKTIWFDVYLQIMSAVIAN